MKALDHNPTVAEMVEMLPSDSGAHRPVPAGGCRAPDSGAHGLAAGRGRGHPVPQPGRSDAVHPGYPGGLVAHSAAVRQIVAHLDGHGVEARVAWDDDPDTTIRPGI